MSWLIPRLLAGAMGVLVLGAGACLHERKAPTAPGEPTAFARPPDKPPGAASPQTLLQADGVRQLQGALRARGYRVPESGVYGQETEGALLAFQRREGLAPTSMPDLETLRRLGLEAKSLYGQL